MSGNELDWFEGRFFQALHMKWQCKLGTPKPDETFCAMYDQACMMESHDKQYLRRKGPELQMTGGKSGKSHDKQYLRRSRLELQMTGGKSGKSHDKQYLRRSRSELQTGGKSGKSHDKQYLRRSRFELQMTGGKSGKLR